jgi:hypothetical protein
MLLVGFFTTLLALGLFRKAEPLFAYFSPNTNIKRQQTKNEQVLTVKALFWRLTIRWRKGQCSWDVYIPFIEHLRQ